MDVDLFADRTERERMRESATRASDDVKPFAKRLRALGVTTAKRSDTTFGKIEIAGDGEERRAEVRVHDQRRHHPRTIQLCGWDPMATPFWVNLVIAGSGSAIARVDRPRLAKGTPVSKAQGALPNSISDLHSLRYFFNPHRVGSPNETPLGSLLRSAGYFSHTVWLADPTFAQAISGIESACHWMAVNARDPEFRSVQLNVYFSGHGDAGSSPGNSHIEIGDGPSRTENVVDALLDGLLRRRAQFVGDELRVSLFFDCCFAAAIARDFSCHLARKYAALAHMLPFRAIWARSLFCSSLDDEQSFDEKGLEHSYFTAAYLNENSSKQTPEHYPNLTQVSQRSQGRQTPIFVRWGHREDTPELRVPISNLLSQSQKRKLLPPQEIREAALRIAEAAGRANERGHVEPVDFVLGQAHHIRSVCLPHLPQATSRRLKIVEFEKRKSKWDR